MDWCCTPSNVNHVCDSRLLRGAGACPSYHKVKMPTCVLTHCQKYEAERWPLIQNLSKIEFKLVSIDILERTQEVTDIWIYSIF